ncbi:hypothetical protein I302_100524 [Kwoniella bestiolae CBS 10118]|uniref:Alpha-1,3/1,6-mannosyltransferase ALG2 n=1 Tax=Kwoniella bestiolae CBS 10118 TaxID=1296100 RepID=A0A1B9G5A2_9TREE|nr:alpha-1,3/alpha-1,6-mannosyltransferase [Kwoniella bestiolae CBS 10118]OCF26219.1 alpha-1,3/alpha-1,6-mannosyltransferase [Kwoniella bestiolae CBS 10118]
MAPPVKQPEKLRIGFIHPDLGIGGAERLVVDASVSLQNLGHEVVMFTSRHDPKRCFEETRDGTLKVHVLGSSIPRSLSSTIPLTIIFSILRSLLLSILLILSIHWPEPAVFFNPLAPLKPFDVFIVDQQSVSIPLLRLLTGTRVVFYCHFPDKLLSGGWEIDIDEKRVERKKTGVLKRVYRWPIDKLEEFTTGQSDIVLSNSKFTSQVYSTVFPSLAKRPPRVVYPCIDVDNYQPSTTKKGKGKGKEKVDPEIELISSDRPTFLSFNRFEAKKNVALAIKSFAKLRDDGLVDEDEFDNLRLVLGGGYDKDEPDNITTLQSLEKLCNELSLRHHTISSTDAIPIPAMENTQVLFILNFTNNQRSHLLSASNTRGLLYTPSNEHFGIVPLEAMSCGIPVLAVNSGGPTETIVDYTQSPEDGTGFLKSPNPTEWSQALSTLLHLSDDDREKISSSARKRVEDNFSLKTLGKELEVASRDAIGMGNINEVIGDILIWVSAGSIAFAAVGLAVTIYVLNE